MEERHLNLEEIIRCSHCGVCLSSCPTYNEIKKEMDSPRGRLYLLRMVAAGRSPFTPSIRRYLDLCLDCRACETVCPSGVNFGHILEKARFRMEKDLPRPFLQRLFLIFFLRVLFPSPVRFNLFIKLVRIYQLLRFDKFIEKTGILGFFSDSLKTAHKMLPPISRRRSMEEIPEIINNGKRKFRVGFFTGCVMDTVFADVNIATINLLKHLGCEIVTPRGQGCCGALQLHFGMRDVAKGMAIRNIKAFEKLSIDAIIANAGGCGAALLEYPDLLMNDEYGERAIDFSRKVRDICQFIVESGERIEFKELRERVLYQDSCHLVNVMKVRDEPRMLLKRIPGIELRELKNGSLCCGSAGIYNILEREMSMRILKKKIDEIREIDPSLIVSGNAGCIIQINFGLRESRLNIHVMHTALLLDRLKI